MADRPEIHRDLSEFVERWLPSARAMQLRVQYYDGGVLELAAPLSLNDNDKGTAFGGSLYTLVVLSGWGMVYLRCRERGLEPNIVVSHGEIEYLRPVTTDPLVARCDASDADFERFFATHAERGKAAIALAATVSSDGSDAVLFSGRYAIIPG